MRARTIVWEGEPIADKSVIKGMPLDVYHSQCCSGPSVSSSNLRRVLEVNGGSPAHFFAEWTGNPNYIEREEKQHLVLGRAVHHLLLGEKQFSEQFVFRPAEVPDRKTGILKAWQSQRTECKAWMAGDMMLSAAVDDAPINRWLTKNARRGRAVLKDSDIEHIKGIAISLGNDPFVKNGLLGGQIERSFLWRDPETGLWCKARPDAVPVSDTDFADLKTTTSVQYNDLANAVRDYAYHQQAALVAEGAKICADVTMTSFTFVFVEKTPPYCVRLVQLKDEDIALGHRQNRAARLLIASCIRSGRWPGPGEGHIVNIDLGKFYRERAQQAVDATDALMPRETAA